MKVQSGSWKQSDLLREREREKWSFEIFFLMKRTKAEDSRVLNSHFLTSDAERMRASTLWVWRCYSGDEAQAESTIIIQLSKWEERQELQASHYTSAEGSEWNVLWILHTPSSSVSGYSPPDSARLAGSSHYHPWAGQATLEVPS